MTHPSTLQNDLILRVARGESVQRPPVWIMRQAGRYLTEYKAVRAEAGSFRQMIAQPAYAAEVSCQPVDLMGVDAAIIFSDILVIPEAIGLPYEMKSGVGPVFPETIRTDADLKRLHPVESDGNLTHTYEAIRLVKKQLAGRVPVIGFAGAPWTLFCYMTEGGGSKSFGVPRSLLYRNPHFVDEVMERLTVATIEYLKGQIAAGADIVQVFDSWGGLLNQELYRRFSLPSIRRICSAITEVPVIVFAKGASFALPDLADLPCEVLGLDWHTAPEYAAEVVANKALQGNMDPAQLYGEPEQVATATRNMLRRFPAGRHIVNLGHGVFPDMPRESVRALVETVKSHSYA